MRKLFAGLTAAIMSVTALGATAFAADTPEKEYALGDVNMDGIVNLHDAGIILNYYLEKQIGLEPELRDEQLRLADVDGLTDSNGDSVNFRDSYILMSHYTYQICFIDVGTLEEYVEQCNTDACYARGFQKTQSQFEQAFDLS